MTNHEAIETLKANYPDACFEQLREAVDTAIFALQKSTHKALDTISRQDAIDVVKHAWAKGLEPTQYIEELPSAQPEITEDDVKEYCRKRCLIVVTSDFYDEMTRRWASAQPESTRTFVELVVEYPKPELCTYKEYKGKPYYSIKYIENGETYVGYGTYNPEVLSQYLKEYFISSAQPDPNVLEQEYLKGWEDGRKNLLDAVSGTLVDFCEQCGEGKKYNGVMCGACNLDSWMSAIEEMKCTIEGERGTDG